eukprot:4598144-Pleurochrysis_carterae.AAC.2
MCDGVQMFKELKDELANPHDAYDLDEHERKIKLMRDEVLLDNCSGQNFADKVNVLIRDHIQPLHLDALRRHEAWTTHQQVPADSTGRRGTRTSTRVDRQEPVWVKKAR